MSTPNNVSVGGGVSTIEVTVPVEVTIPVEVTVPGETVTIAGDTVTITVEGEPTTVTVEAEPVTVTVEAEPVTVTVEAEPVTVTVQAEPATVTVQADPKTNPTFSLGEWAGSNNTYSAVVSYNGDGVLTANTGTLSGSTITVEDEDGNFNGVISADEGNVYAPGLLAFSCKTNTIAGETVTVTVEGEPVTVTVEAEPAGSKETPYLAIANKYVFYDGDGDIYAINGTLNENSLTVNDANNCFVYALETDNYASAIVKYTPATFTDVTVARITPSTGQENTIPSGTTMYITKETTFKVRATTTPANAPFRFDIVNANTMSDWLTQNHKDNTFTVLPPPAQTQIDIITRTHSEAIPAYSLTLKPKT